MKAIPSEPHRRRPLVCAKHPQHVVIRVVPRVGGLRRKHMFRALRGAIAATATNHKAFRICHISVQQTHVHLLVEADDRMALARGMQGFQIAAAHRLNAAVDVVSARLASGRARRQHAAVAVTTTEKKPSRRGSRQVFLDRYHATAITKPRQARHALAYVLNNWRRHGEHTHAEARGWRLDPYSSAAQFAGWEEARGTPITSIEPRTDGTLQVRPPSSWLLRVGWKVHGYPRITERPGPRPGGAKGADVD